MFIIVALVYKSALSLCENLIAAFGGKGSHKMFFWMYTDAETRIWFCTPARVRSRVVLEKKTNGGNREVSFRESEVLTGSSCGLQFPRSAMLRRRILAS